MCIYTYIYIYTFCVCVCVRDFLNKTKAWLVGCFGHCAQHREEPRGLKTHIQGKTNMLPTIQDYVDVFVLVVPSFPCCAVCLLVCSFIRLCVHLFVCSFLHWARDRVCLFVCLFVCSFIGLFVDVFVCWLVCLSVH